MASGATASARRCRFSASGRCRTEIITRTLARTDLCPGPDPAGDVDDETEVPGQLSRELAFLPDVRRAARQAPFILVFLPSHLTIEGQPPGRFSSR
jgi:hypothetical protein